MRKSIGALYGVVICLGLLPSIGVAADPKAEGERVATEHCARCHVVSDANRMGGIGSTPSFKLLRGMPDWEERYASFFARNPHPAFVTIEGLSRKRILPPNAAPITLTERQLDALMTYVRAIGSVQ